MLTLGWLDGNTFLSVNSVLNSSENKKNRINEAKYIDKRTVLVTNGVNSPYKKEQFAMLELLKATKAILF